MTSLLDTPRPRLLLTLLCLVLWMPGFFTLPAGDRDESRFAQATKQMLETGDYVRIMNGTEARNRKPIGIHWLQAPFVAAAQTAGLARDNPIWPYRIPAALGGLVAVLACFELGLLVTTRRAALLAAGMLAAAAVLVVEVHIAKTDAALMGATTVAMAVLARAYLDPGGVGRRAASVFWLAMGAGVLLKGPITPMVAGLTVAALAVLDWRAGRGAAWLRALRASWGLPLMLAVVLPWFIAIGVATGGRFFTDAVVGDLGRKLTSGDDAHWGPPGLHLLLLPFLLFPAAAGLPGAASLAWRERGTASVRFLLCWIIPAWIVFEAAPTKLPHYPLPLYPALCLLVARGVFEMAPRWRWACGVLGALTAVVLAAGGLAAPIFLHLSPWLAAPAVLAAIVVGFWAVRATTPRLAVCAILAAPLVYGALLGWELPRLRPVWIAPLVAEAMPSVLNPGLRLGSVGYSEPSLMFLAGTGTLWLGPDDAAQALADGTIDVLLVSDRDLASVGAAIRAALAAKGALAGTVNVAPGFNYSRGRAVTLTAFTLTR